MGFCRKSMHLDVQTPRRRDFRRTLPANFLRLLGAMVALTCGSGAVAQESSRLLGASRGDVIRALGEPENSLRKGDVDLLVYADGVRIEIKNDQVIRYRGPVGSGVLTRGGTDYSAGDDGNIRKPVEYVPEPEESVVAEEAEVSPDPPELVEELPVEEEEAAPYDPEADPEGIYDEATANAEKLLEDMGMATEPEPPPAWATAVGTVVGLFFRTLFVLLVLRLTLAWMGRPCFFPDLIKISLLYTALFAAIEGLGNLGGNWEFLHFFRVSEIIGMFALSVMLYSFEVTRDGLTALKIAGANALITHFVMMGIGIVIVLTIGALY
jgi:hypothetical protein